MASAPYLNPNVNKRLKTIDPHIYVQWDAKRNRWKIMEKRMGRSPRCVTIVQDKYKRFMPFDERTIRRVKQMVRYNNNLYEYVWELQHAEEKMNAAKENSEYEYYKDVALGIRRYVQTLARKHGIVSGKTKIPYAPGFG